MPVKFYTGEDFGGTQIVNTPDPVNPQDVAAKHYVDAHVPTPFSKQILWENAYNMRCLNNSYAGSFAGLTSGPNVQTITKLRADTGIRVKLATTCFVNTPGTITYGVSINGSSVVQLWIYYVNVASNHLPMPLASQTLLPASVSQIATTGSMNVTFYVATGGGITWNTNDGDSAQWTIAEVMP